jgi:hypothetical protein
MSKGENTKKRKGSNKASERARTWKAALGVSPAENGGEWARSPAWLADLG